MNSVPFFISPALDWDDVDWDAETQRYVNMARQLKPTSENLHDPQLPKKEG